ncbi:hypothetical protein C2R22_04210 [Salinigranum rubrum]|uniref:DUF3267 domain-containing protein n=1 Tax=Salinigranum rubrum TaxID=755307 RepID=A0A2I8VG98_9EURY|nr:DUF3267 domain-containing protein [Salinigranum rubrum]AUV80963.1 hypothetical protein C2R22_04210 [Salinigranum rubrum]
MSPGTRRERPSRWRDPPDPPAGYGPPSPFEYPALWLQVAAFGLALASLVGYAVVLLALRGPGLVERFVRVDPIPDGLVITPDLFLLGGVFVAVVVGVPVVHELVHATVYRLLGYDVSYGVAPAVGGLYVAAFGQFQTRRANLAVAFAPLAVLTPVGLLGMVLGGPVVQAVAYLGLVLNTAGAVGDLYLAWVLVRLPAGTLMFEAVPPNAYVYEPLSAER